MVGQRTPVLEPELKRRYGSMTVTTEVMLLMVSE